MIYVVIILLVGTLVMMYNAFSKKHEKLNRS